MHLTTEEFVQFVIDDLPEEIEREIDKHIAQCQRCALQLGQCYDAEDEFPQARWAAQRSAFVAELREKIFTPKSSWAERFAQMKINAQAAFPHDQLVLAESQSERRTLHEGKSADSVFRWIIAREKNGDLGYMFESQQPIRIKFRAGAFEEEVTLKQVTQTAFFAEVIVPGKDCPEDPSDFDLEAML
jgi:hypothetical protein